MAKITWLGEDEGDIPGPSFNVWGIGAGAVRFDKGKSVEVTDLEMITNARGNRFYKVEGGPGRPVGSVTRKTEADDDKDTE